jgi:hypothetical protein
LERLMMAAHHVPVQEVPAEEVPALDLLALDLLGTNHRLRLRLESLGQTPPVTPELIAGLLSELLRAGQWLGQRLPPEAQRSPQLQRELSAYRQNVEQLRGLLPGLHRRLLTERARLEAERARLQGAVHWAQASRQTL